MHSFGLPLSSGAWRFGVGDPTIAGWLITGGYVLAALRCLSAARADLLSAALRPDARPWLCIAAFAAVLGINKQLDLQTLLIEWGRTAALEGGWYERRRIAGGVFFGVLGLTTVLTVGIWARRHRYFICRHPLLCTGIFLVLFHAGLRAADSIHAGPGGVAWPFVIEGTGVSLLVLGAGAVRGKRSSCRADGRI
jgi:hypothetical protein